MIKNYYKLKVPISRLYLYEGLINNKEIFSGQVKSILFKNIYLILLIMLKNYL